MSVAYSGNYIDSMFDSRKRYRTHFQKGVPLSCNELDEIQEVSDSFIKQLITANFPRGSSINNGFKVIESATDNNNNFTIQGGDGSVDEAGVLFVDGYILFLRSDIEYIEQGYDTGLTPLVDDGYTKSFDVAPALNPPVLGTRIDEVYVDFYFAEVSATGTGVGTEPPEYKDTDLIVPGIGFSTANRLRMVQDVRVIQGGTTPADGDDSNGIYHRYVKIATIERDTSSAITQDMITDDRILVNSISSYALGETQTDLILSDGSSIGDDTHRISSIFMASDINFTSDLSIISQVGVTTNERVRFTTDGLVGIGTTDPQAGIHLTDSDIRIQNTSPKIDFYADTDYQGYIGNTGALGIDIFAQGAGKIRMHTNGDERVGISSNGYVGIGTEDPQRLLHIQGDCYVSDDLIIAGTSDFGDTNIDGKLTIEQNINDNCIDINQTNAVSTAPVISISNSGLGPSFVVDNGYVGIGTTIPAARIQVMDPGTGKYTARFGNAAIGQYGSVDVIANSGTNSFQVWDDGNLTTPRFIVKRSGSVGIGTTNPSKLLSIRHGSSDGIRLEYTSSDENVLIDSSSIQAYDLTTPSIFKLNQYGGNVGIGTSDPQFELHVEGVGFFKTGGVGIKLTGNSASIDEVQGLGQQLILEALDEASLGVQNAYISLDTTLGDIQLITGTSSVHISSEDSNDNVVVNTTTIELNGNVGIGTTDPQFVLHVEGQAFFNTIGGMGIKLIGDNGTIDRVNSLGTTLILEPLDTGSVGSVDLQLIAGGSNITVSSDGVDDNVSISTTRVQINGNVGIGTAGGIFSMLDVVPSGSMSQRGIHFITDDTVSIGVGTSVAGSVNEGLLSLCGGRFPNSTYGAYINISGNDSIGFPGGIDITTGTAPNSHVYVNSDKLQVTGNAQIDGHIGIGTVPEIFSMLDVVPSGNSGINFIKDDGVYIGVSTSVAGSVNKGYLSLCGGRFPNSTYGAYINISGNDSSGFPGGIDITTGTAPNSHVYVNSDKLQVTGNAQIDGYIGIGTVPEIFSMLDVVPNGNSGIHFIKDETVSIGVGTDSSGTVNEGSLSLCGGITSNRNYGGYIKVNGNDSSGVAGGIDIITGIATDSYVYVDTNNLQVTGNAQIDGYIGIGTVPQIFSMLDVVPNGNSGIHFIKDETVSIGVGTDSSGTVNEGSLSLCGGIGQNVNYGGYIKVNGNDFTSAPGSLIIVSGSEPGASIYLSTSNSDTVDIVNFLNNLGSVVAKIDSTGQIFSDAGTTISSPADFAEWTQVKENFEEYEIGTIVQQSKTDDLKVEIAIDIDKVYGVVTDRATFCGGLTSNSFNVSEIKKDSKELNVIDFEKKYNAKRIAMTGHVFCKVVGNICRGDRLVLSSMPGVAKSACTIEDRINSFAIARQSYNSYEIGLIEVRL